MAFHFDEDSDELNEQSDINVTPFIDVILVLLIIFMIAAPLSTVDIHVDLPVSTATAKPRPDKPVFVTIQKDMRIAVGEQSVADGGLGGAIDAVTHSGKDTLLFVRADKTINYDRLMQVMNLLRAAGYLKVALVGLEALGEPSQPVPTSPTTAQQ